MPRSGIRLDTVCGLFQVLRMVVSTYQAASGAGAAAMEELELQTREVACFYWNRSLSLQCIKFTHVLWEFTFSCSVIRFLKGSDQLVKSLANRFIYNVFSIIGISLCSIGLLGSFREELFLDFVVCLQFVLSQCSCSLEWVQ